MSSLLTRPLESRAIADFLAAAQAGPCGLILEGEAGIGKTALWLAASSEARERGFRVMSARSGPGEVTLTYAVVADLLRDVDASVLDMLSEIQRAAVDKVLLRGSANATATDERVLGAALLTLLEHLAGDAPVVVAIDDLQWLDTSSSVVLSFVARRSSGRIGFLATVRSDSDDADAASQLAMTRVEGMSRVRLAPLSLGALHTVITDRLGRSLPRPLMVRIHEVSGGNPLYALELARMLSAQPDSARVELPTALTAVVRARIGALDAALRDVLLAAASAAAPTVSLVADACGGDPDAVIPLLERAESARIVHIDCGRVQFTHPLLATGVYADAEPAQRRAMHRRLAAVVDQPELKARHLALASTSGDPVTLEALDAAAAVTQANGAPAGAAELVDLAIRLGGDTPVRRIQAAAHHFAAGDALRARELVESVLEVLGAGVMRAIALNLLAGVCIYTDGFVEAAAHLSVALIDARENRRVAARTRLMLSFAQINAGQFDESLDNGRQVVAEAEALGDPSLTSQALSMWVMNNCICGNGIDEVSLQRSLDLEDLTVDAPIVFRASANNAQLLAWKGNLDAAHTQILEMRRRCAERGAENDLLFLAVQSVLIEIWRGNLSEATLLAADAAQRAEQLGGDNALLIAMTVQTAAAAYIGREQDARHFGQRALEAAQRCGSKRTAEWPTMMLAFLAVSLTRYTEAVDILQPVMSAFAASPTGTEIISATFIPDAAEALLALGRPEDAEPLICIIEENGARLDRPWMLAVGARARSMWLAAHGDLEAATATAYRAMDQHQRLAMPFERARTQLLLGQLQRRQRFKEAAGKTLHEALCDFERIGTTLWADRARAELTRTNVSRHREPNLTPSEQRVAELAASGMTTRGIAAALFISTKTVEHNLTRVYRKLGIRGRAQLGRRMDELNVRVNPDSFANSDP